MTQNCKGRRELLGTRFTLWRARWKDHWGKALGGSRTHTPKWSMDGGDSCDGYIFLFKFFKVSLLVCNGLWSSIMSLNIIGLKSPIFMPILYIYYSSIMSSNIIGLKESYFYANSIYYRCGSTYCLSFVWEAYSIKPYLSLEFPMQQNLLIFGLTYFILWSHCNLGMGNDWFFSPLSIELWQKIKNAEKGGKNCH